MPTEIRMPMWGMGMLEGTIVEWFKKEGDAVEAGEPLAEVEAAKTTEDLVAPAAGVLQRIVVPEGATVPVQELLAVLLPDGEEAGGSVGDGDAAVATPDAAAVPPPATEEAPPAGPPAGGAVRNVVPRARQRARELDVDLGTVTGTGPGGRIVVDDVERAASQVGEGPAPRVADVAAPPAEEPGTIPLTGMRGTIARRMHASLQSMAQLTLVTTADVTDLVEHRAARPTPRPTYTDYVVRAAALALREHPALNATVEDDRIRLLDHVHVGVATAVPDGLVVPVVRDADTASLADVARTSAELVEKVRSSSVGTEDVTGSTFTVTSLGGQGIDAFTPIVNPPEVAILGVGRIVDQPVRDGDALAWRKVMTLSLTIDHRAVDGAPGAAFLETVVELLSSPERLAG